MDMRQLPDAILLEDSFPFYLLLLYLNEYSNNINPLIISRIYYDNLLYYLLLLVEYILTYGIIFLQC
jgi:hypothetical protein